MVLLRSAIIALALGAVPAAANAVAFFNVSAGPSSAIQTNNDFKMQLSSLLLKKYSDTRNIALVGKGKVTFEFLASESGYTNAFKIGSVIYPETAYSNFFSAPVVFHTGIYTAATFKPSFITASPINVGLGIGDGLPGTGKGFGIFSKASAGNGAFTTNTVYFGMDDRTGHPDLDFDDMIVRATVSAVPEPAVWGSMILGFGLIGGALRRRVARTAPGGLATA
jgi:hypothetical protein